MVWQGWGGGEG
ncbi:hypothetical protein ECEC1856_5764, partial [Escherichia coli EC1856]